MYIVFDAQDLAQVTSLRDSLKQKSETYVLLEHLQDWNFIVETHNGRDLVLVWASFSFASKADAGDYYNWIQNNIPQNVLNKIIYAKVQLLDNTHHYSDDQIRPDVILFERIIGSLEDANFEY